MIIYGSRASHLKSIQLPNEVCPNCNTKGHVVMSVYSKYAHIFWIPIFPVGRTGASQCMNCQQVLEPKKMPTFLRMQYDQLFAGTRIPLWSWSGLAIIIALISWGSFSSSQHKDAEKEWIKSPIVGDHYRMKTGDGMFTIARVAQVSGDSVFVEENSMMTDKMSGVYELKSKEFTEGVWLNKSLLESMYASDKIYAIDR